MLYIQRFTGIITDAFFIRHHFENMYISPHHSLSVSGFGVTVYGATSIYSTVVLIESRIITTFIYM